MMKLMQEKAAGQNIKLLLLILLTLSVISFPESVFALTLSPPPSIWLPEIIWQVLVPLRTLVFFLVVVGMVLNLLFKFYGSKRLHKTIASIFVLLFVFFFSITMLVMLVRVIFQIPWVQHQLDASYYDNLKKSTPLYNLFKIK